MNKYVVILLIAYISSILVNNRILEVFLFILMISYHFPIAYVLIRERLLGMPLLPSKNIGCIQVTRIGKRTKYSAYIEIKDSRHNILDFSPIQFYGHSKLFIDGLLVDPEITSYLIYTKRRDKLSAYVKISYITGKSDNVFSKIKAAYEYVIKHLEGFGLVCRIVEPLDFNEIYYLDNDSDNQKIRIFFMLSGMILLVLSLYIKFSLNYYDIIVVQAWLLYILLLKDYQSSERRVRLKTKILELYKNEVIQTVPSLNDIFRRSRWIYNLINNLDDFVLILEIKSAPEEISELIEKNSYRKYEIATALDKLSLLSSAERMYTTTKRRLNRRENYYKIRLFILVKSKYDMEKFKKILSSIGFKMRRPLYQFTPYMMLK
ncbi:MAG: hypothetical protein DRJ64_03910 [Thermoprotei archaeon]|nr:MAG: hypothetical protein DRJ64_03910 [Thermoprotei archaeon]